MSPPRAVRFRVSRSRRGDQAPHYDEFDVPVRPRMTVLDALLAIRARQDPGLTLRHSCLHASCGTCGMRINGREQLACVTQVAGLAEPVLVQPLAGAPVTSDLVVDMRPLYEALEAVGRPLLRSAGPLAHAAGAAPAPGAPGAGGQRPRRDGSAKVAPAGNGEAPAGEPAPIRFEDCIECGICTSACPVTATDRLYLGPAALAATERLVREPRGGDLGAALRLADQAQGAWRCHVAFECSEACPSGVDPGGAIMALRRELLRRRFKGLLHPAGRQA